MKGERLEQEIRLSLDAEVKQAGLPGNLVSGVMARLGDQQRPKPRFDFIPRTRLAWTIVLLALLSIGGTAYAATSLMGGFFRSFAPDVEEAGLIVNLNLSQTIDGVTVRLVQGYADSNTVLIGYTITGRNARQIINAAKLSLASGQDLRGSGGMGHVQTLSILNWHPSEATFVIAFDPSDVEGNPAELDLRFETIVGNSPIPAGSSATWGPFAFNFKLPFHPGKTVIIDQTVEAAGVPITLQKVVITPAATGAVFLFHGEYIDNRRRPLQISLLQPALGSTDNSSLETVKALNTWFPEDFTLDTYPGDFTDRTGEWIVTITELVFKPTRPVDKPTGDYGGTAADIKRLAGPWIFRFEVP